ncbi:hypothetical protein [Methylobacterium nigriterrae]|uniref:hypothetical protein n=1 Tax=Methylobacterium nigriterrae TaxID=3127512 RepID=UPI0030132B8E
MKGKRPLIDRIKQASTLGAKTLSERFADNLENPYSGLGGSRTISDADWKKLTELSGLKEADRFDLEGDIILYRNNCAARLSEPALTPADTREQLEKLARDAQDLHLAIERTLDNDGAAWALTAPTALAWGAADIWSLSEKLKCFAELASTAAGRCKPARTGPGDVNLHGLIESAALRWAESAGLPLSISKKRLGPEKKWNALEFIIATVRVADPEAWRPDQRFPNRSMDDRIQDIVKTMARRMRARES